MSSLAASASFRSAAETGIDGYPDDYEDYQSDVSPDGACGADNERLLELGYRFDLCAKPAGHGWMHEHIAL